jgi:ribosomal protein S18 acetylase RimI-like enzyme
MLDRPYHDISDQAQMLDLAQHYQADSMHVTDLPYRLSSWAMSEPENSHLWFDAAGSLRGWAVLQTPFWAIDTICPADLHGEVLAWADQRARQALDTPYGHSCWFINAFTDQIEWQKDLEAAGFACQADVGENSWTKVWMLRPAELPVKDYRVPAGFTVRSLAGEADVPANVDLHQAAFESKNMTIEWRARTLQHPGYCPELDVVVAAPDGRLGAFCICWLQGDRGQVEPLGCHKDFRRYALGRIALAEGLRRLQAAGAREIYVETDNYRNTALALYEAMGFQVIRDVWVYRKDYD